MKRIIAVAGLLFFGGCAADDKTDGAVTTDAGVDMAVPVDAEVLVPQLTISPNMLIIPSSSSGQAVQVRFELEASVAPVELENVSLALEGATARLLYKRTFQTGIDAMGMDRFSYPIVITPDMPLPMMLEVTPNADSVTGTLNITGNFEGETLTLPLVQGGDAPQLSLSTMNVDFGRVAEGDTKTESIVLTNVGGSTLTLQNVLLRSFGVDFSVTLNGEQAVENSAAYADPDDDGSPGIAPGGTASLLVTYAPMSEGTDDATLTIQTNSLSNAEQNVEFVANQSYSCMDVSPEMMRCEGVLQELTVCDTRIVISNCDASEPLIVDRVQMNASTDAFFIDADSLPSFPHLIEVGGMLEVEIRYLPGVARSNHRGNLLIHANDLEAPNRNISITGFTPCATTDECPQEYACIDNECVFQMMPGGDGSEGDSDG